MKIVVTGSAGYVGSYLIKKLLEDEKFADYEILGVDNFLVGKEENHKLIGENKRLKLLKGDICDKEFVKWLLRDTEIVYHLAAISGVVQCSKMPHLAMKVNIEGTLNLLEASNSVEYFVYPSSAAVYGEIDGNLAREDMSLRPLNNYGAMKVSCEALCGSYYHMYGLGTIVLRFTNICGVGLYPKWRTVVMNFILRALKKEPLIIHGSGEQRRDCIHISDVVEAYKLVITPKAKGEIFNVGSGSTASIKELAEIVSNIASQRGLNVKIVFKSAREIQERTFGYDISKLRLLGFNPRYNIIKSIEKTFNDVYNLLKLHGFKEYQKEI